MKKIAVLVASLLLCGAGAAGAEHRLLITDVLDPGHVDARAAWEFVHYNGDLKGNVSEAFVTAGVGVAKDLELNVSLPYVIKESFRDEEQAKGWGNFSVGGKYRLLNEKPFTLTAGLNVAFDTGSHSVTRGEHFTIYAPFVAASKDLGHETKPYAVYRPVFNSNGPDSHTIVLGLEKELARKVTLDARLDTTFFVNENDLKQYALDLALYLEVAKNLYLLPAVGVIRLDGEGGEATGLKGELGLYYTF
ncbi:MAG TPA: hypothetical protein VNX25_03300 [Verrucomicrobiae bacterium]|nr:hypothetical protein [Verrucomicrobiae bacterium]